MSALFSTPKMPKMPEPMAMPDPEDLKARLAKRKAMDGALNRKGRDSTILGAESGGTKDYAGQSLGGPQ
jgi:hypothetical protein